MRPEPVRLAFGGPARPEVLDALSDLLDRVWGLCPAVAAVDRMSTELAVAEIATNMVEHCMGELGMVGPGAPVGITADVAVHADRIEVDLVDPGPAAVVDLAAARLPDDPYAERGRGLALVRAVVGEVGYVRDGDRNRWWFMLRRTAAPVTAPPAAAPTRGACGARTG